MLKPRNKTSEVILQYRGLFSSGTTFSPFDHKCQNKDHHF